MEKLAKYKKVQYNGFRRSSETEKFKIDKNNK